MRDRIAPRSGPSAERKVSRQAAPSGGPTWDTAMKSPVTALSACHSSILPTGAWAFWEADIPARALKLSALPTSSTARLASATAAGVVCLGKDLGP